MAFKIVVYVLVKFEFTPNGNTEVFDVVGSVYHMVVDLYWENICSVSVTENDNYSFRGINFDALVMKKFEYEVQLVR